MKTVKDSVNNKELIKYRLENNIDILGREHEKLEIKECNKYPENIELLKKLNIDLLIN